MLKSGDIIDGIYEVIREIGAGGTGVIYLGYHIRLRKQIVVKRIKENYTGSFNVRGEADILKRLHHMYLPQVYDFVIYGQDVYTVMDYIPGNDLQHYLKHGYTFSEQILLKWLRQLCEVLKYLHAQEPPILHCDIKPGNIMITPQRNVCLIDFNISLDGTEGRKVQGISPHYAAPEQYECAMAARYGGGAKTVLDERMDIYSLGAVFYRLMTGYLPDPVKGLPYPIQDVDVPYSSALKGMIAKAVEFTPSKRFRSAQQMLKALDSLEKMDPQYRGLERLQLLAGGLYGMCLVAGILLFYGGVGIWQKQAWQSAYSELYQASDAGDEAKIITTGTRMLNDVMLKGYAKKHPEEKAEVLCILGESYFRQEQYESAARYYLEALDTQEDDPLYLRDYLAALARDGESFDAEELAERYPKAKLETAELCFVEAQSELAAGDLMEAQEKNEEAAALSMDPELLAAVYDLQADIYVEQGDYQDAYAAMRTAAEYADDRNILRKSGQMAFEAGNEVENDTIRRSCYEDALQVYEELCSEESPSYEDQLNRALVLRALGRYSISTSRLLDMQKMYPDDYKIPMWMCYNYLDEAVLEGTGEVPQELDFCYSLCRDKYRAQGTEDTDMEQLIETMDELERE